MTFDLGTHAAPPPTGGVLADAHGVGSGRTFGDFSLRESLGEGGTGQVWLAANTFTGQRVAVKICSDPLLRATLTNEARNLGTLMAAARQNDFPDSIVRLHETHLSVEPAYLVMEYVAGGDLRRQLREGGALTQERALAILLRVLEALEFAHGLGLTHRDIKPENILIDEAGRAKVSDFGLGKAAAENLLSVQRSLATQDRSPREISGTFDYMAPEQLAGATDIGPPADIYALGVVMFEMLTGERPRGLTMPTRRRPELHRGWDELFERCYAHDVADRFGSVAALRAAVERVFGATMAHVFAAASAGRASMSPGPRSDARAVESEAPQRPFAQLFRGARAGEMALPGVEPTQPRRRFGFRRRLRRTADLLNVERRSETLSPEEKLHGYFGYRFFGWILPSAIWLWLAMIAAAKSSLSHDGFGSMRTTWLTLVTVVAACYLLYVFLAREESLRGVMRGVVAICLLAVMPMMLAVFVALFRVLGPLSPLIGLGLHMAFLTDVAGKLKGREARREAAAWTAARRGDEQQSGS